MRTGDTERRAERLRRGRSPCSTSTRDAGRALLNRGNVHLQQGDAPAAAADFTAAARRFGEAGIAVERAKAEHNLGYVELLRGDLVGALHEDGRRPRRARSALGRRTAPRSSRTAPRC